MSLPRPRRLQHPQSPNWSRSGVPVAGPRSGVRRAMTAIGTVALIALPKARSLLPPAKLRLANQATAPNANVIGGANVTAISANLVRLSRRWMALLETRPLLMARRQLKRAMTGKAGRAIASMARDTAETGTRASSAIAKTVDATRAGTRVAATEAVAIATEAAGKAVHRIGNMRRVQGRASVIVRSIRIRGLLSSRRSGNS